MLAAEPSGAYGTPAGDVPVAHPPGLADAARAVSGLLGSGARRLSELLRTDPPEVTALLLPERDWRAAPRDGRRPYPYGLPYFTRATHPPTLVLPLDLAPVFGPRTEALLPLTLWHELAHAFLLRGEVVRVPPWLGELLPQALSAAVARREGLPLADHLAVVERDPGFGVRGFGGRTSAGEQMAFQNLLLLLGDAALERFGEGFLPRLADALWERDEPVGEEEAVGMLAEALGSGGGAWLGSRPEFRGDGG